jgi:periplasmic divalent cation tolerance protein
MLSAILITESIMPQARIVLSTAGNLDEAERLAHALVEGRLAACVSLVPKLTSIYRWQGEVERAQEILLLIKTTADQLAAVEAELHRLHSYQVPEFLVLEISAGSQAYLDWLGASVGAAQSPEEPSTAH